MHRNALDIAYAQMKHWLLKEDRYSQQSPFIFSIYQGALDCLKKEKPLNKAEKVALLVAYFCQITKADQVLELGSGNEVVTKLLSHATKGTSYRIPSSQGKASGEETFSATLKDLQAVDFVFIHPLVSDTCLQELSALLLPQMHSEGILVLTGIHKREEMNRCWKKIQADERIRITLDFFDFGVAFLSYSGPKTALYVSY